MNKLRRSLIKYTSAVFCVLLLFANSNIIVLCIGQDGHVEFEITASKCCEDDHANKINEPIENHHQSIKNNDCGACVDIPVSYGLSGSIDKLKKSILTLSATAAIVTMDNNSSDFCNSRVITPPLIQSTYFTPLSTIILLA